MTETTKPEFTITRTLDAPRDLVWRLWTTEDELVRWHGPKGARIPRESQAFDVREGGTYRYTMINDETGEEFPTGGTYLEITPPSKLVYTWGNPGDPVEVAPVITVTLAEQGERTHLTFHLAGIAGHPGDGFVHDGWAEVLDHLAEHIAAA